MSSGYLWSNTSLRNYVIRNSLRLLFRLLCLAVSVSVVIYADSTALRILVLLFSASLIMECDPLIAALRNLMRGKTLFDTQQTIAFDGGEIHLSLPANSRMLIIFFEAPLSPGPGATHGSLLISNVASGETHQVSIPEAQRMILALPLDPVFWKVPKSWSREAFECSLKFHLKTEPPVKRDEDLVRVIVKGA